MSPRDAADDARNDQAVAATGRHTRNAVRNRIAGRMGVREWDRARDLTWFRTEEEAARDSNVRGVCLAAATNAVVDTVRA